MSPPPPPRRGQQPQHTQHHGMYMNGRMNGIDNNTNNNGTKRSRVLWDEARYYNDKDQANLGSHSKKLQRLLAYCRAIGYELQPIRYSQIDTSNIRSMVYTICNLCWYCIKSTPYAFKTLLTFLRTRTKCQWMIVFCIVSYYYFVRLIHEWIEGGPMVIIITSLIAIFTIGLGDEQDDEQRISAYSVFNRGFQRLLGSVDADALLAQHVGGGLGGGGFMMGGGGGGMGMGLQHDNDDINRQPVRHRDGAGNGVAPAAAAAAAAAPARVDDDNNNANVNDENDGNDNNNNQGRGTGGRARKSGKKARRRNLDQRRQNRQQQESALALGLQLDDNATPELMMEIQRLIEEQIAAENVQAGAGGGIHE